MPYDQYQYQLTVCNESITIYEYVTKYYRAAQSPNVLNHILSLNANYENEVCQRIISSPGWGWGSLTVTMLMQGWSPTGNGSPYLLSELGSFRIPLRSVPTPGNINLVAPAFTYYTYNPGYGVINKNHNCSVTIYAGSNAVTTYDLPVYPNTISDSNQASFSPTTPLGRSVAYQSYTTSSRSVSFTLELHEELCSDYTYVRRLVSAIESACYPEYSQSKYVMPPEIYFKLGESTSIRGILTSVSAQWDAPIIDNKLVKCTLSVSITETTGPYSQSMIKAYGGNRGESIWH